MSQRAAVVPRRASAGVPSRGVDVMHGTDTDFAKVLDVNTRAVCSVLRAAGSVIITGQQVLVNGGALG
jgi:hypothetical protein